MNRSDIAKMVVNARSDAIKAATGDALNSEQEEQLVSAIVVAFLEAVTLTLQCDETVVLYGFGRFQLRRIEARTMVSPSTGEKVEIPERRSISFVPSKPLKDRLSA